MSTAPEATLHLVPFLILMAGLVTSMISLPLIWGKVPPNVIYGIRTKQAFSSRENWYRINKYGGKMFLRAGLLTVIVGLAGVLLPSAYLTIYAIVAAVIVLGAVLVAGLMCLLAG